jgi:hypothetical protein
VTCISPNITPVLKKVRDSVADPEHFGKLDPDQDQSGSWIRIRKQHQNGEQDPYPYQSEKLEAGDGIFGAQVPNLGKSEW